MDEDKINLFSSVEDITNYRNNFKKGKKKNVKYICKKKTNINKKSKKNIPKKIKEQVWLNHNGKHFSYKCYTKWCTNNINVFNFHVGHNILESRGGKLELSNLYPICDRCNLSMSNNYTITEWNNINLHKNYKRIIYKYAKILYSVISIILSFFTIYVIISIL